MPNKELPHLIISSMPLINQAANKRNNYFLKDLEHLSGHPVFKNIIHKENIYSKNVAARCFLFHSKKRGKRSS